MCDVVKILEREQDNTNLVYIYRDEEDGRWYAYEHSALLFSRLTNQQSDMGRIVIGDALWLARVEVDLQALPAENIICTSDKEYVVGCMPSTLVCE